MLYKKNDTPRLSEELFQNPTSEYRGAPFWAWNCALDAAELKWQIDIFKRMGFGGFHIHVRTGLVTEYLSNDFMKIVRECVKKAKREDMLAWLYDEDRWPSGAAGGLVTKEEKYRARYLLFTPNPYTGSSRVITNDSASRGGRTEQGRLLAAFDVTLSPDGYLTGYRMIGEDEAATGTKWYAYLETSGTSPWYNNQTYVNTLDKKAIARFIEVTHERYKKYVGNEFGATVPAVFTDEPQFTRKGLLNCSTEQRDVVLPWTDDLEESFRQTCGDSLTAHIPELFWELEDRISVTRYRYHDHIAERFSEAFADTVGAWCRGNGIALTGHMMEEPTLHSQTAALGEAMRSYRGFDLPGIDMLCASFELTTAKQAQSAAHQYGREGVLSELYGVTGWAFDFRDHKLHGDWQAALGVTVRVPHLSWASMAGEAKRDYPASIHFHSPWFSEYGCIEDHFARVNTAMTRGKPIVKVGVIHPVESFWLHWGPNDKTALYREQLDDNFRNLTDWLLKGSIDFDFIAESLLPGLCEKGGAPLRVGEMAYEAVLVPACETLRSTTLERLEAFREAGGKLLFLGGAPTLENAEPSERGAALARMSVLLPFARASVLTALADNRVIAMRYDNGRLTDNLLHGLRQDGDSRWLFVAHASEPDNKDGCRADKVLITMRGEYSPTLYDTSTGEIHPLPCKYEDGNTLFSSKLYEYDSLLIHYTPGKSAHSIEAVQPSRIHRFHLPSRAPYVLSEDNVMLLDMASYRIDDGEWHSEEEILRLDNLCREKLGLPPRGKLAAQPWAIPDEPPEHTISLRFIVESEMDALPVLLALENAAQAQIVLNASLVENRIVGWFTDKSIQKVPLGKLQRGYNVIEITLPFGIRTNTENCYLLGCFGVKVQGRCKSITALPATLAYGDVTSQGLPFYSANITYYHNINTVGGDLTICIRRYRGALVQIALDDYEVGHIIYPPYCLLIENVKPGRHRLCVKLFTHRNNCFGAVHLADNKHNRLAPAAWRTEGDLWSYEYNLMPVGLLSAPEISEDRSNPPPRNA